MMTIPDISEQTVDEWLAEHNQLRAQLRAQMDNTQALWAIAHALETAVGQGVITDALQQARCDREDLQRIRGKLAEMRKVFVDDPGVLRWLDEVEHVD